MTDAFQQPAPVTEPAPGTLELDPTLAAWYEAIKGADAQVAYYQEIRARAIEHIQQAMGDATKATVGGRPVISWQPSKPSLRLDRAKLEEAYGRDEIARYLVPSKAARPFKILAADGD